MCRAVPVMPSHAAPTQLAHARSPLARRYAYLAMHGGYGLTWLVKDATFPDRSWEAPASVPSFAVLFCLLGLFWITPALVASSPPPPAEVTGLALVLYVFGFFMLHTGDAQKFFTLRLRPNALIDDGLFARTRNPNYFGELLIYSAFALSACGSARWWPLPWAVNVLVWSATPPPRAHPACMHMHMPWAVNVLV